MRNLTSSSVNVMATPESRVPMFLALSSPTMVQPMYSSSSYLFVAALSVTPKADITCSHSLSSPPVF